MKLRNLLDVFQPKDLASDQATLQRDFGILRSYLGIMFPFDVDMNKFIVNLGKNPKDTDHPFVDEFLPFHTRDQEWLAKYLYKLVINMFQKDKTFQQIIFDQKNDDKNSHQFYSRKQPVIKYDTVKKFIMTPDFNQARDDFEQDLTRAFADYMVNNGNSQLLQQGNDADEEFRIKVIKTMQDIGVNPNNAEISLEKHADNWRQQTMTDVFYDIFSMAPYIEKRLTDRVAWDKMLDERERFKPVWLQQRLYRYYQRHQDLIEKLNLVTPTMEISDSGLEILNQKVATFENNFQAFTGQPIKNKAEPLPIVHKSRKEKLMDSICCL